MHFTALLQLSRNGRLWDRCWNILHFECKNTLASDQVFGGLWLVGEDKFILHIVYHLQLPAACSTASLREGKGSSASSLAWCSVVCTGVLVFILVFHFHSVTGSVKISELGGEMPAAESFEFLAEMEQVLPKHP